MIKKVADFFRNSINNLSSGYLVYSRFIEDAVSAGDEFINMIFCDTHDNCGHCLSCRKFRDGNMISYLDVCEDDKGDIKIGAVREIQDYLNTQAKDNDYRCIHIKGANKMTIQSQNYLLKTLEEPPKNVVFVLSTDNKDMILETVKSRLIDVNIPVMPKEEIVDMLLKEGTDEKEAIYAASLARGSYLNARKILGDERTGKLRDTAERILLRLATKKNPSMFLLMQDFSEADRDLVELLYIMDSMLMDAVIYPAEDKELENPDRLECIRRLKSSFTLKKLKGIIEIVNERIQQKLSYPQFRDDLMTENMIIEILEVIA